MAEQNITPVKYASPQEPNPSSSMEQPKAESPAKSHKKIIVICSILLIATVGFCSLLYFLGTRATSKHQQSESISSNLPKIPTLSPSPIPVQKISQLVTFDLPQGWEQEKRINPQHNSDYLKLTSPNLSKSCCGGPDVPAVKIDIKYKPIKESQTIDEKYKDLYDEANDPNPNGATIHSLTRTKIAGYPAISYLYDFEGHNHTYLIWTPKYLWEVSIYSPRAEDETKNSQDINYILQSLKFIE